MQIFPVRYIYPRTTRETCIVRNHKIVVVDHKKGKREENCHYSGFQSTVMVHCHAMLSICDNIKPGFVRVRSKIYRKNWEKGEKYKR